MFLQIGISQVYYEVSGKGDPLLLMHGGLGSVRDFASQTAELSKHFRVFAFERPGHGRTADTSDPFSFDDMADLTVKFIETVKLGAVNPVGWSDGAIIGLLVAISRPDLVKRLVSVGGLFNADAQSPQALDWIRSLTPESFKKAGSHLVKRYEELSPDGPAHFPIVLEKTKRLWLNEPKISKEDLARITCPTLVMDGDRDSTPLEHTLDMFRSIKGAQLCIIPGTTHFLLSEKPETANKAILDFLATRQK